MAQTGVHIHEEGRGTSLGDYVPLIALVGVSLAAALAIAAGFSELTWETGMRAYMGVFLTVFALLKLFDIEGFANGFEMYDLAGKRSRAYARAYPFVELGLGLWWFSGAGMAGAAVATIVVFVFGAVGVVLALRRGLDIDCPCMGNILSVPLSTVTLTEDAAMVAMAGAMLLL
jgi:hypothetical protein